MTGKEQQSDFAFRLMAWEFKLRDWLRPPENILREAGVRAGMRVLDFGCGPGGFSLAASALVGKRGFVYALDIQPVALQYVQSAAKRLSLENIKTIHTIDFITSETVDFVMLYDVFHDLSASSAVLFELYRKLKAEGILSVSDHHLKKDDLLRAVTKDGFFQRKDSTKWTSQFIKTTRKEKNNGDAP